MNSSFLKKPVSSLELLRLCRCCELRQESTCLYTRTSGEAKGRPAQARPATPGGSAAQEEPTTDSGRQTYRKPTHRAVHSDSARSMPTAVPEPPGPAPHLRPPRPALEERRAVTVSAHSSRSGSWIRLPAPRRRTSLPSPAPSLPALGTSEEPFAPPLEE